MEPERAFEPHEWHGMIDIWMVDKFIALSNRLISKFYIRGIDQLFENIYRPGNPNYIHGVFDLSNMNRQYLGYNDEKNFRLLVYANQNYQGYLSLFKHKCEIDENAFSTFDFGYFFNIIPRHMRISTMNFMSRICGDEYRYHIGRFDAAPGNNYHIMSWEPYQ